MPLTVLPHTIVWMDRQEATPRRSAFLLSGPYAPASTVRGMFLYFTLRRVIPADLWH